MQSCQALFDEQCTTGPVQLLQALLRPLRTPLLSVATSMAYYSSPLMSSSTLAGRRSCP